MKVLGIDPGTAACGFGIVQTGGNGRLQAVEYGWWETSPRDGPSLRLKRIHDERLELIVRHEPDAVAFEESYVGADARIALSVGTGARRRARRVRGRGVLSAPSIRRRR